MVTSKRLFANYIFLVGLSNLGALLHGAPAENRIIRFADIARLYAAPESSEAPEEGSAVKKIKVPRAEQRKMAFDLF